VTDPPMKRSGDRSQSTRPISSSAWLTSPEPMAASPCGIQQTIPPSDVVWRLVRSLEWNDDLDRWIPTEASVRFDAKLSVYWREHVVNTHASDAAAITKPKWPLVYADQVADLLNAGFGVEHDPDGPDFADCAHTSVSYPVGLSTKELQAARNAQRARMAHVYGAVDAGAPTGA